MKVLVAMDTSTASHAVLEVIVARPWPPGSSLEILSIIEPSHVSATADGIRQVVRHVNAAVQNAIERLQSAGWESTGGAFVDDDPKVIIIDRARRMNADLIVVGSHGRSALGRFLLGSVAAGVLRYAPCSVEIVRAKPTRDQPSQAMKILLATDGSDCSVFAASSVAARPWPAGTEVRILSAIEVRLSAPQALIQAPFLGSAIESARAEGIQGSHRAIAEAINIFSGQTTVVSESGPCSTDDPKIAILLEAVEWEADLIVLGSHGRKGMDRFQLGSVSEGVALHAPCSVEVIRKRII